MGRHITIDTMARPYRPVGENDMANPLIMRELRNIPQLKKGLTHYGRVGPWPEGATPLCPGDLAKKAKLMRRPKRQECHIRNAVIAEADPAYSTKPITKMGPRSNRRSFSSCGTPVHAPEGIANTSIERTPPPHPMRRESLEPRLRRRRTSMVPQVPRGSHAHSSRKGI